MDSKPEYGQLNLGDVTRTKSVKRN